MGTTAAEFKTLCELAEQEDVGVLDSHPSRLTFPNTNATDVPGDDDGLSLRSMYYSAHGTISSRASSMNTLHLVKEEEDEASENPCGTHEAPDGSPSPPSLGELALSPKKKTKQGHGRDVADEGDVADVADEEDEGTELIHAVVRGRGEPRRGLSEAESLIMGVRTCDQAEDPMDDGRSNAGDQTRAVEDCIPQGDLRDHGEGTCAEHGRIRQLEDLVERYRARVVELEGQLQLEGQLDGDALIIEQLQEENRYLKVVYTERISHLIAENGILRNQILDAEQKLVDEGPAVPIRSAKKAAMAIAVPGLAADELKVVDDATIIGYSPLGAGRLLYSQFR